MDKLETLEKLINRKINILNKDFKVSMDSRNIESNTLFFAINKGNEYVKEALDKGAFIITENKDYANIENAYYVASTVEFMQKFAKTYRENRKFKVIAITGSNGKTTVKDILYNELKDRVNVFKTQGNYNNHIGLPYTILSAKDDVEYLILEMGMSALKEIDLLANISKPDISIITNIGQSHLEYLKTMDNVFKAKTELIAHTKDKIFVNAEDKYLSKLKKDNIILVYKKEYKTNLLGEHNQINISLVDAVLNYLNFKDNDFTNIELTSGRFEILEKKYRYINDAYNASPMSMKVSIETFSKLYNEDYKIIAIADMLELGKDSIKYHEEIEKVLENKNFDEIILYGKYMKYLYEKIKDKYKTSYFTDKEDIKKAINDIKTNKNKTILLKGSRSMFMEKIMEDK